MLSKICPSWCTERVESLSVFLFNVVYVIIDVK